MATSLVRVADVDKTDRQAPRSGKRVALNIAVYMFGSIMAFFGITRGAEGPLLYIFWISAIVLLGGAIFEAARWLLRTKSNRK